jgi:hypothetical protein
MSVDYEWQVELVETYEDGDNDVIDMSFYKSYAECVEHCAGNKVEAPYHNDIVLVCDDDKGRSWAYLEDGKLPSHFADAYSNNTRKVPQKYHKEIEAYNG